VFTTAIWAHKQPKMGSEMIGKETLVFLPAIISPL
jgi:hypothetical protein